MRNQSSWHLDSQGSEQPNHGGSDLESSRPNIKLHIHPKDSHQLWRIQLHWAALLQPESSRQAGRMMAFQASSVRQKARSSLIQAAKDAVP